MADTAITAANVLKSADGQVVDGIAGATITAGQVVYVDTGDSNKLKLADADGASPANVAAGIALHGASAGQPLRYCIKDSAFVLGATLAAGDSVFLSDAPGGLTINGANASAPDLEAADTIVFLGVMVTTTTMNLNPTVGGVRAA